LLAAHIAPYGYLEVNPTALSSGPTWAHPFGTDQIGRDYFSRVVYGIGTEVEIVLLVAFFGTAIGTLVGAFCGYFGGGVDNVLMRFTDLLRTTKVSASPQVLIEDAQIYGFGDEIGYGGYTAMAVAGHVPYPLWIDTRDLGGRGQEVFGARLSADAAR